MTRTGTARAIMPLGAISQAALAAQIILVTAATALTTPEAREHASPRAINSAEARGPRCVVG
jgi:hypothetical protein